MTINHKTICIIDNRKAWFYFIVLIILTQIDQTNLQPLNQEDEGIERLQVGHNEQIKRAEKTRYHLIMGKYIEKNLVLILFLSSSIFLLILGPKACLLRRRVI